MRLPQEPLKGQKTLPEKEYKEQRYDDEGDLEELPGKPQPSAVAGNQPRRHANPQRDNGQQANDPDEQH